MLERLKQKARGLRAETLALYLAARHPDTPWLAKLVVALVVAYALSPIDLIPDFIPILGQLDDLILVPLGIALAIRLVPSEVMTECRLRSSTLISQGRRAGQIAAVVIIAFWIALTVAGIAWYLDAFPGTA